MSSPVDDTADEVKVFRSNDVDEMLDTAQSSQQLNEDKKDVAFEAEMEAPVNSTSRNRLVIKLILTLATPNLLFGPFLGPSMFSQLSTNNLMYPVFMQSMSPHYAASRLIGSPSFSLLSPNLAALSMCSPQYTKPSPFSSSIAAAAFMNPPNFLTPNLTNQMAAHNLQRLIAQQQQQMQGNAARNENVNPNLPTPRRERVPRQKR